MSGRLVIVMGRNRRRLIGRRRTARRRGSILVLVMTILGLLFVTGVAFMATMNFEAQRMRYETQRSDANPAVGRMMLGMDEVMSDMMTPNAGASFSGLLLGSTTTYAEMPGVHNLFSPIEPNRDSFWDYWWPWVTDIRALRPAGSGQFDGSDATLIPRVDNTAANLPGFMHPVNLKWQPGTPAPIAATAFGYNLFFGNVLDADGDGVSDSYATPLVDVPGFDDKQIEELKKALNPPSNPDGDLSLGLRVVAHGGLVNLTYSHYRLVESALGLGAGQVQMSLNPSGRPSPNWPYNPTVEEPQLRRRNFLLPRELTPSGILGNPLIAQSDVTGGGDYSQYLFTIGDALDRHRYWPYGHDELGQHPFNPPADPDIRIHSIRLDPEYDPSKPEYYDRRHLVTSISHDANIRRLVAFVPVDMAGNPIPPPPEGNEIMHWMHRRNREFLVSQGFASGAPAVSMPNPLPFEVPQYPLGIGDAVTIVSRFNDSPTYPQNYCACLLDVDPTTGERLCVPNPRKGNMKLSLPWLEQAFGDVDTMPRDARMVRLIYDSFILMLLNMRVPNSPAGVAWGSYVENPAGSGTWEWRWTQAGLDEVSRLAASLTANLIDYADSDDMPTEVAIRSLDFSLPGTLGNNTTNFVYGLERQPFISEVAAYAIDQNPAMPTGLLNIDGSLFGVELFNPFGNQIDLSSYRIVTNRTTQVLSTTLSAHQYAAFVHDPAGILPGGRSAIAVPMLEFTEGSTIFLQRNVGSFSSPKYITVDSLDLSGTAVGRVEPAPVLDSAQRSSGSRPAILWTVPIPETWTVTGDGVSESFGSNQGYSDNALPNIYLENADSGSFTSAFPTTGMMLMLMRNANTAMTAFTTYLDDDKNNMGTYAVDNGRMPVFDPLGLHHMQTGDYYALNDGLSLNRPGDVMHLPWGQFVFDYFTALPLSSPGPYALIGNSLTPLEDAPPKVDLDGLRVHGRININAAPWKVMEGLPLIPMNRIDTARGTTSSLRMAFEAALYPAGGVPPQAVAGTIGAARAKAIAAYRDMGQFFDPINPAISQTGNYAERRAWDLPAPPVRRGSGFMTVGELANVRHPAAQLAFTLDDNQLNPAYTPTPDYLNAIALLACLQDWATVRSDTFTVYGTLRGVEDQTIVDSNLNIEADLRVKDADARALRFQESGIL